MITLYHGSTIKIPSPLVKVGRTLVDFGQGFYLTRLEQQASLWAETIAERRKTGVPVLNEYGGTCKTPGGPTSVSAADATERVPPMPTWRFCNCLSSSRGPFN